MITESIAHARHARDRIDAALSELVGGRAASAAPELAGAVEELCAALSELAGAVEELCAALSELAWAECDRAAYGTSEEG